MVRDNRWSKKSGKFEPTVAVGSNHHRDFDLLVTQSSDAPGPLSLNHPPTLEPQPKLGKEGDGVIERFHHDADVVHPK
jgi:hypothetical protein